MAKQKKKITTKIIKIDEELCPSQEILINGIPADLWYIEGEDEPTVELTSFFHFRLSEIKELVEVMTKFDKDSRKALDKAMK